MNKENKTRLKSQAYMSEQILKWREKRQSRMDARISGATFKSQRDRSILCARLNTTVDPAKSRPLKSIGAKTKSQKLPEIKHTLASKLRMIKANPLLEVRGIVTLPEKYKKNFDRFDVKNKSVYDQEAKLPVTSQCKKKSSVEESNGQKETKRTVGGNSNRNSNITGAKRMGRRSLSADRSCTKSSHKNLTEEKSIMKRFHSVTDMKGQKTPITEEDELENDIFPLPVTPLTFQTPKRCVSFSSSVGRKSAMSPSSLFTPTTEMMRKQLADWLKKRGKSVGNFTHLQCFGLHASNKHSDFRKSNYRQNATTLQKSNLPSKTPKEPRGSTAGEANVDCEHKENVGAQKLDTLAQDALEDLIKIIKLGYPLEQCNLWLTVIRQSFPGVKEVPVYWECFALLEEARGDLKSAVDCYERAIIRGASPEKVSDSLDKLMEKFNLLNIKPDVQLDGTCKTPRKQVIDARNIFKSTIIRFALQQKAVRSLSSNLGVPPTSLNYIATPVRRSSRCSTSRYSVTPGVVCVQSLNQLEPDIRKSVVFKPNHALD